MTAKSRMLYQSGKPAPGASAFVAITSTLLVSSPVWTPMILAWAGYRAVRSSIDSGCTSSGQRIKSEHLCEHDHDEENLADEDEGRLLQNRHEEPQKEPQSREARDERPREKLRHLQRREQCLRWGILVLLLWLSYMPVRRWARFLKSSWWEKFWFNQVGIKVIGPQDWPPADPR